MQSSFYSEARIMLFVSLSHLLHFQAIYQHSYPFSCSCVYDNERETRSQTETIWTIMTPLLHSMGFGQKKKHLALRNTT